MTEHLRSRRADLPQHLCRVQCNYCATQWSDDGLSALDKPTVHGDDDTNALAESIVR